MKKILILISACVMGLTAAAQSVSIYHETDELLNFSPADVDSIVFKTTDAKGTMTGARYIDGTWCAIGTSITWYNDNVASSGGRFTRGYQDRVLDKLMFSDVTNAGDNGGTLARSLTKGLIVKADYYTIEHGINDWGNTVPVGTIDDYINNTGNGTFAASYRQMIDKLYALNPNAKIVLCTPRKGYGFSGYLPANWYDAKGGIYLKDYADLVKQIAEYESLPVADFFGECGGQHNLDKLSIDVALHPNDDGYQLMANVLIKALEKIIVD